MSFKIDMILGVQQMGFKDKRLIRQKSIKESSNENVDILDSLLENIFKLLY